MTGNIPAKYDYRNIDNYIKDEYSVCREERQYALFLHNILLKCKNLDGGCKNDFKGILEKCGLTTSDTIKEVFYEATFMRDFFRRDKRCTYVDEASLKDKLLNIKCTTEEHKCPYDEKGVYIESGKRFNYLLIKYALDMKGVNEAALPSSDSVLEEIISRDSKVCKDIKTGKNTNSILDLNLGGEAGRTYINDILTDMIKNETNKDVIKKIKRVERAGIMMNIKPDIAIIYERAGNVYLRFLECKFESSEDRYSDSEDDSITQTKAQMWVGEFLCGQLKVKYEKKDLEWGDSKLIYFRRKNSETQIGDNNVILLEEMILA